MSGWAFPSCARWDGDARSVPRLHTGSTRPSSVALGVELGKLRETLEGQRDNLAPARQLSTTDRAPDPLAIKLGVGELTTPQSLDVVVEASGASHLLRSGRFNHLN